MRVSGLFGKVLAGSFAILAGSVCHAASVTADTEQPGAGPASESGSGSNTKIFADTDTNAGHSRGQSFTTDDTGDTNTHWSVTEIALQAYSAHTFGDGDNVQMWLFEWNPSTNVADITNWATGDGLSDGDPIDGTVMGAYLLDGVSFDLPDSVAANDYLHFKFDSAVTLKENKSYGTFFVFNDADASVGETFIQVKEKRGDSADDGMEIRTTPTTNNYQSLYDLTYSVTGTACVEVVEEESDEVVYFDSFDADGLAINNGIGGGMAMFKDNTRSFTWDDTGNLDSSDNDSGNRLAAVYSTNSFAVVNGFKLDVTYTIDRIVATNSTGTQLSYTASFGLITAPTNISSSYFIADNGQTSIGVSLTEKVVDSVSRQGLNEINPMTGLTSLADEVDQPITIGTNRTFSLTVSKSGAFSYSIDGKTPTVGQATNFDLSEKYHFAVFEQYMTGIEIQDVTLTVLSAPQNEGVIDCELLSGGTKVGLSWYGEFGRTYVLKVTDDLMSEDDWTTITNVVGDGSMISLTNDVDMAQAFYGLFESE
jgi:hypothetical protein